MTIYPNTNQEARMRLFRPVCEGLFFTDGIQGEISSLSKERRMGKQEARHYSFTRSKVRTLRSETAIKIPPLTSFNLQASI